MLLAMCTPEMLPEGRASQLARSIVVNHLRRPNFEGELVAAVPGAEKERVLRDFHVQPHRCGFMQKAPLQQVPRVSRSEAATQPPVRPWRSEEQTHELQSLMRNS